MVSARRLKEYVVFEAITGIEIFVALCAGLSNRQRVLGGVSSSHVRRFRRYGLLRARGGVAEAAHYL